MSERGRPREAQSPSGNSSHRSNGNGRRLESAEDVPPNDEVRDRGEYTMSGGTGPAGADVPGRSRLHRRRRLSQIPVPVYTPRFGLTFGFGTFFKDCVNYEAQCLARQHRRLERRERKDAKKRNEAENNQRAGEPSAQIPSPELASGVVPIAYQQNDHSQQVEQREMAEANAMPPLQHDFSNAGLGVQRPPYANNHWASSRASSVSFSQESRSNASRGRNASSHRRNLLGRSHDSSMRSEDNVYSNDSSTAGPSNDRNTRGSSRNVNNNPALPSNSNSTPRAQGLASSSRGDGPERNNAGLVPQIQVSSPSAPGYPVHILPSDERRGEPSLRAVTPTAPPTYRTIAADDEQHIHVPNDDY